MTRDIWHFPRPKLAKAYIDSFQVGLTSARALFARRRMGKSEFLNEDLIPAAQKAGYLTAYVNLWDNQDDPGRALIGAIYVALEVKGWGRLVAGLNQPVKKIKASGKLGPLGEGSLEAEIDTAKTQVTASDLQVAMALLDKNKKPLLLVIDEAQVLAQDKNSNFTHGLRAALDVRKGQIKVIFAGSSESTLRRMFARPSEPFYNWAALEPFELLGRDFVEAMVEKVDAICRYPLPVAEALAVFVALNSTPEFFRRFLDRYLTHPLEGTAGAHAFMKSHIFNSHNFNDQWSSLTAADQTLLSMLAAGTTDLYSKEALIHLGKTLGLPGAASKHTAQNALKRLSGMNLVTRMEYGKYQFEDEVFADWVRHLALEE
jgi:hypothetical protein